MPPSLIDIVRDWLKLNRPYLDIDKHGTIFRPSSSPMKAVKYCGAIGHDYAQLYGYTINYIKAADPEFFKKLAQHLE